MAVTTTTSDAVAARLTGKKIRWGELVFEGALLLMLLMSLLVLITVPPAAFTYSIARALSAVASPPRVGSRRQWIVPAGSASSRAR